MAYYDFIEREIEGLARFVAKTFMQRDLPSEEMITEDGALSPELFLKHMLSQLIAEGNINRAEDMLFEWIDESPRPDYLPVACWFYETLNKLSDEQLDRAGFPRGEIAEGLAKIKGIYNYSD